MTCISLVQADFPVYEAAEMRPLCQELICPWSNRAAATLSGKALNGDIFRMQNSPAPELTRERPPWTGITFIFSSGNIS